MARGAGAACHGANKAVSNGVGVGSIFCMKRKSGHHLSGSMGVISGQWRMSRLLGVSFSNTISVQMYLWVGVSLVANGSGERERDAGGAPPAALQARARFYWQLVISKPICGRHGARGHSRRLKCPLWMSSTQVGKLETNWAEGAVAGGLWAASAAANATLWALLAGIRAHNLCSKGSRWEANGGHRR